MSFESATAIVGNDPAQRHVSPIVKDRTRPMTAVLHAQYSYVHVTALDLHMLEAERAGGKTPEDAIFQASLLRFRPILMTTMAALFAGIPLAFGGGTGAELRRPLGISIIGGLLVSQLLTLYTTPVIYLTFDRLARRFHRHRDAA